MVFGTMNGSVMRWLLNVTLAYYVCCAAMAATQTLTVNTNGSGTVSRNPTNTVLPRDAVVTLTAVPSTNWMFTSWSGDAIGSVNPTNIIMNADKVIAANFSPIPSYVLTVSIIGEGTVSPPGGTYQQNTIVSLTATAASEWAFREWTGDLASTSNPVNVTMNTNKTITALFGEPPKVTAQPQSLAAGLGDNVMFSAAASGTAPLSYNWRANGALVTGKTNASLTISNVQLSHAGEYVLVVGNAYGSATSQVARLTVTNACPGSNLVTICDEVELRRAIVQGGDVRFCCSGTIVLRSAIRVTNSVSLDAGSNVVTISGNRQVRLFDVAANANLGLKNLVLANGEQVSLQDGDGREGGAIRNLGGVVHLLSCILSNNASVGVAGLSGPVPGAGGLGRGGAIFNQGGAVRCESLLVISNSVTGGNGGFAFPPPWWGYPGDGLGGALYSDRGSIFVTNSIFVGNHAHGLANDRRPSWARGGAIEITNAELAIGMSRFVGNFAAGQSTPPEIPPPYVFLPGPANGGALSVFSGRATLLRVEFFGNTAAGGDGRGASGTGEASGGAIHNLGVLDMWDSTCSTNSALAGSFSITNVNAGKGGALYNGGTAYISRTTFSHNVARGGDAGPNGRTGYGQGGGVFNARSLSATNCTLALNQADTPGGISSGGGLQNALGGTVFLMNSTLASNAATQGGNLANTNGAVALRNSLLAYGGSSNNASGVVTDGGFNMSSDGSCNFDTGSSFNFTDPKLDQLRNNGGPSPTMALLPDSPAMDFGSAPGAPATDQRGARRPYGLGVDMGAFEVGPRAPFLNAARRGSMLELSFTIEPDATYELQRSSDLVSWEIHELIGPAQTNGLISRMIPMTELRRFFQLAVR